MDSQAAFLKKPTDHCHVEYFQGLERFREQGIPNVLAAARQEAVEREARSQGLAPASLQHAALRSYQEEWVEQRRKWKIDMRGKECVEDICRANGCLRSL